MKVCLNQKYRPFLRLVGQSLSLIAVTLPIVLVLFAIYTYYQVVPIPGIKLLEVDEALQAWVKLRNASYIFFIIDALFLALLSRVDRVVAQKLLWSWVTGLVGVTFSFALATVILEFYYIFDFIFYSSEYKNY
jgi:hypothetical protein